MKTVNSIDTDALSSVVSGYSEERLNAMATDFFAFAAEKQKIENIDDIKKMISAESLGISESSPIYGFVDDSCKAVNNLFDMPLYGENSVSELAEKCGVNIPGSKYSTVWDMAGEVSLNYIAGNKIYGSNSVEAKIALSAAKVALREIIRGKTDSFLSSAADAVLSGTGLSEKIASLGVSTPSERFAAAVISVVIESFGEDNDGVNNISGTVPGYGAQTNGFSSVCGFIVSAYSKFIMYINIIIGALMS